MKRPYPTYGLYGETAAGSEQFWLHCETIPERSRLHDWEIRPHRHEAFFQVLYISHGAGEALVDGLYRPFGHDTAIFVPPGPVHGFRFSRDIGGIVVTVLRDRLDAVAATDRRVAAFAGSVRVVSLPGKEGARAREALAGIEGDHAGREAGRTALLGALVVQALVAMARLAATDAQAAPGPAGRDEDRMERLEALIALHCREHRPVGFYAERLGVSPAHLNRIARSATGASVQALLARALAEAAGRDLVFTFLPAQSIALALGFSDPAYFSRFFRRQTGMTPLEFRAAERERLRY